MVSVEMLVMYGEKRVELLQMQCTNLYWLDIEHKL